MLLKHERVDNTVCVSLETHTGVSLKWNLVLRDGQLYVKELGSRGTYKFEYLFLYHFKLSVHIYVIDMWLHGPGFRFKMNDAEKASLIYQVGVMMKYYKTLYTEPEPTTTTTATSSMPWALTLTDYGTTLLVGAAALYYWSSLA